MTTSPSLAAQIREIADTRPMSSTTRTRLHAVAQQVDVLEHDCAAMIRIMRADLREQARDAGLHSMVKYLEERP